MPKKLGPPETSSRMAAEYEVLRAELAHNTHFIFERPLLIVGVSFAGLLGLKDGEVGHVERLSVLLVFFLFFMSVLYFNLWFTFNRLLSNSRILAYLVLVHEGRFRLEWQGWETSLHKYRQWMLQNKKAALEVRGSHHGREQYDTRRFYAPILYFHCTLAFLATSLAMVYGDAVPSATRVAAFLFPLVFLVAFIATTVALWRPKRIRNAMEAEMEIWGSVLEEMLNEAQPQADVPQSAASKGRPSVARGVGPATPGAK